MSVLSSFNVRKKRYTRLKILFKNKTRVPRRQYVFGASVKSQKIVIICVRCNAATSIGAHEYEHVIDSERQLVAKYRRTEDRNGGALSRCSVWFVIARKFW